jgi:hypothetical protein
MENSSLKQENTRGRAWLLLAVSAVAGLVTVWVPAGFVIVPALWAYAAARTKPAWMVLLAVIYVVGALSFYTTIAAIGMIVCIAATAAALFYMQIKHVGNTYTALTLAGVSLLGLYISVALPGVISGDGAFAAVQSAMDGMIDFYREALTHVNGANAEYVALANEYLDAFSDAVPSYIVSALCIFAGVLGLGNLLFFRLFCRKHPEISLAPMRAFRHWALPRSMMLGLLLLLVGSLVLSWSGWPFADSFGNTVNVLVGMPLLLQGLCVIDFLLVRAKKNITTRRAVVYTAIGVLFSIAQMPLILIGCFEQIFHFRTRVQTMPPRTM